VRLSPTLAELRVYPFVRLTQAKNERLARGEQVVDFGVGEPREETPAFIRAALADAIEPMSTYPSAEGLPELREAIAGWASRRFGAVLDPATEVVPTLGSKEAIFHLAQVVGEGTVALTVPGYPVPERGALFAGRKVFEAPLEAQRGFLPDLDSLPLDELALLWLNYPNNPTAATVTTEFLERAAALAREHDFVLASDEAYSEIYFGPEPPVSALALADRTNVVAFNTLSKRSSMPGYRSGFAAGDPQIVAALKRYRPNVGVAPQEFVQRAAVAAWNDEQHVDAVRAVYRSKRDVVLPAFEALGMRHAGGDASFFLWLSLPAGESSSEDFAKRLLDRGVLVAPGAYFGASGEGYVRVALVPTLDDCRRAAQLLAGV
jgi:succinyldiaminopimelate transaminase